MFGIQKGKFEEIDEEADGKVIVNIQVERINRKEREVQIKVFDRGREENVFKADYVSRQSEAHAHSSAQEMVKRYTRENDYVIDVETTNVELPTVQTLTNKRSR